MLLNLARTDTIVVDTIYIKETMRGRGEGGREREEIGEREERGRRGGKGDRKREIVMTP